MMYSSLWLIPSIPLFSALACFVLGSRGGSARLSAGVATAGVAFSFALACSHYIKLLSDDNRLHQVVMAAWMHIGELQLNWELLYDPLAGATAVVICLVSVLIHVWSLTGMSAGPRTYRLFCCFNLFTCAMLLLVLGGNAAVMLAGWEGAALSSCLLIGFYYDRQSAVDAAKTAFVVHRIGDVAFVCALIALFSGLGEHGLWTLNFVALAEHAHLLDSGGVLVTLATLCLFAAAAARSAQFPLFTWLPRVASATAPIPLLLHAVVLLIGGIYMVVRMNSIFVLAPTTLMLISLCGAVTAIVAAMSAFVMRDIKQQLAWVALAQTGCMFLAAGGGIFSAATLHLLIYPLLCCSLFLALGTALHDQSSAVGLRDRSPLTFWTFIVTALFMLAIPGFYVLFARAEVPSVAAAGYWPLLAVIGLVSALNACALFRPVFSTFASQRIEAQSMSGDSSDPARVPIVMTVTPALSLLAAGASIALAIRMVIHGELPFSYSLVPSLSATAGRVGDHSQAAGIMVFVVLVAVLGGILVARILSPSLVECWRERFGGLREFLLNHCYIDELCENLVIKPCSGLGMFLWKGIDGGLVDGLVNGVGWAIRGLGNGLRQTQSGLLYSYAIVMVIGVIIIIGFFIFN